MRTHRNRIGRTLFFALAASAALVTAVPAPALAAKSDKDDAGGDNNCKGLPSFDALTAALKAAVKSTDAFGNPTGGTSATSNGGLDFNMWATIVNREGKVCTVARSGGQPGDQWPGSRVISAQKANAANAFSLPKFALSTANLYEPTQPGHTLWELTQSNPVDAETAYEGEFAKFGSKNDPLKGRRIGGVNVFGGGVALYDKDGNLVGGLGVSGDTSCSDHIIAWKVRHTLNLDDVPNGVAAGTDNLIPAGNFNGAIAFGHPECGAAATAIITGLPVNFPVGPTP